tara:strand:- start:1274 stop:1870 length:597 start_codon:yes stop_codon:yes gene_type:complete
MASSKGTNAPYLLDQSRLADTPLPVFKDFSEILSENAFLLLVIFAFLLLSFGIWLFLKKKKTNDSTEQILVETDPYEDALLAISSLQEKQKLLSAKPFVFKLSEILRIYIQRLFRLPAMELTGEEFMVEIASHSFFKDRYEALLRDFVDRGDRIKYSRENTGSLEINELLASALHFVKDTHAKLIEEENHQKQNSTGK